MVPRRSLNASLYVEIAYILISLFFFFFLNPAASGGKECNPYAAISSSAVGEAAQGQEHLWPFAGFCQPKEGETGRCQFTAKPCEVIKETNTERALCPLTCSVSNEWYR